MIETDFNVFLENVKENVDNDEFTYEQTKFYTRLIKNMDDIFQLYKNNIDLYTAEKRVFKASGKHVNDRTIISETLKRMRPKMCDTPKGAKDFDKMLRRIQTILHLEKSPDDKIKEIKRLLAEKSLEYDMDCFLFETIEEIYTDHYYALEAMKRRRQYGNK